MEQLWLFLPHLVLFDVQHSKDLVVEMVQRVALHPVKVIPVQHLQHGQHLVDDVTCKRNTAHVLHCIWKKQRTLLVIALHAHQPTSQFCSSHSKHTNFEHIWNDWSFRPRFCTVRLYWAGNTLGEWDEFCNESGLWTHKVLLWEGIEQLVELEVGYEWPVVSMNVHVEGWICCAANLRNRQSCT